MHATGIICEYNPFHNGHEYHIKKSRERCKSDVLICVMSGNFVQRGEVAIVDKWERTKVALTHGCDIVIELPFAYACQSATQFAYGAITSLHLAQVQDIVFGSELDDIQALEKIASQDSSRYPEFMKDGSSVNKAYEKINGSMHPNDILGVSYLRALKNYNIKAYTIKRTNSYHGKDMQDDISSATAIRLAVMQGNDVATTTCMAKQLQHPHHMKNYYPYIQFLLMSLSPAYLKTLFLMDEGIEHHLIQQANRCSSYEEFLQACTSRRYSTSRIRRTLVHLLNQTQKSDIDTLSPLQHIRVLGFNSVGKNYLKELKKQDVHIASRFNQIPLDYRTMELKAARVYGNISKSADMVEKEVQPPIVIDL